jgi:hypothetical protein
LNGRAQTLGKFLAARTGQFGQFGFEFGRTFGG